MIDCSDVETAGIRMGAGNNVTIWLCYWHMLKAVSDQTKKKLAVTHGANARAKADSNRDLRAGAIADFRRLVYAPNTDSFDDIWEEHKVTYTDHPSWLKYVESEWVSKKERWGQAWQKVLPICCPVLQLFSFG